MKRARPTQERFDKLIRAMAKTGMLHEHYEELSAQYDRWKDFMLAGGAPAAEVFEMLNRLWAADAQLLGRFWRLTENDKHTEVRRAAKDRIDRGNLIGTKMTLPGKRIVMRLPMWPVEKSEIRAANKSLLRKYPVPAQRYRAIAEARGIKVGRVRYAVEGPRRAKKK